MFTMRFAMRSTSPDPAVRADLYQTTLDMAGWAESRGCLSVVISQHHASEDGYLPSPVPMAAALAASTSSAPITVAALLLPLYEPVKLAEDLAVVDLISRGRVSYIVGIGYREEEFAMFAIDRRSRGEVTESRIRMLKALWAGETVDVEGRKVRVTPPPFTPGGPMLGYGGGTEAAARRAGRLGLFFLADRSHPELEAVYREEAERAGVTPLGCQFPSPDVPLTVFVADDPDRAWTEIGPYLLVDALSYGEWNASRGDVASISFAQSVEELRLERGQYQILTPDEARVLVARGVPIGLQPLVGGLPPDLGWKYLETAASVCGA
jgi:alkanesulfonate monooxygenase SsuD/methylene tetrahydromethanopterin reductase-like flavin-dependent oxidoreductase (luciferase family)